MRRPRCRAGLLGFVLLGFAVPGSAQNPIPEGLPLEVTPLDFNFRSCQTPAGGFGRVPRTYRLRNTSNSTIKIDLGGETATPPEDWIRGQRTSTIVLDPAKVREVYLEYTYAPQQAREGRFVSQFLAHFGGQQFSFALNLNGKVEPCEAPEPPAVGDPPPAGEPPPPGTVPPPELDPVTDVCLHFWLLDGSGPVGRETIDSWVREANQIFWNNSVRVRFTQKEGSPAPAGDPRKSDNHCFDVYVGDENLFPGSKAGECRCVGSTALNTALRDLPIDEDYSPGLGTEIEMEPGGSAGATLAHELGHAMGLGAGPDERHDDPSNGEEITDTDRLMNGTPDGATLTPLERDIANIASGLLKGSPDRRGCEKSQTSTPDPRDPERPPGSDIRRSVIRNVNGILALDQTFQGLIRPNQQIIYTLEFDTDLDGNIDRSVRFTRQEDRWQPSTTPPELIEIPFDPPQFVSGASPFSGSPRQTGIVGMLAVVPKQLLGVGQGTIGYRVRLEVPPVPEEVVPKDEPFIPFDVTDPLFTLGLNNARIQAASGGVFEVGGPAFGSSTYTGHAQVYLRIEDQRPARLLSLGTLPNPLPEQWRLTAELPADLAAGTYPAAVIAVCQECSAATTLNVILEVTGSSNPLVWLALLVAAAIAVTLILRRRLRTG